MPLLSFQTDTSSVMLAWPTSPLLPVQPRQPGGRLPLPRSEIWRLSLARLTFAQTVDAVDRLIARGSPSFFITANLHYAMLCDRDPRLAEVNRRAAFIVADGMPMVWYARLCGLPLPERVAGADLVWHLCARAALAGHRVFLLGGAPGVAQEAATVLTWRYPGLRIVGTLTPPHRLWTAEDNRQIIDRVRQTQPDLLFAALGQPKGELWLDANCQALGVPACVQIGASLDFIAGRALRAPTGFQRVGLEWLYRLLHEPRRLGPRYLSNALFLAKAIARDLWA